MNKESLVFQDSNSALSVVSGCGLKYVLFLEMFHDRCDPLSLIEPQVIERISKMVTFCV